MSNFKEVDNDVLTNYLQASALGDAIYVIGMMQSGVTVYNQQVRALNLLYALDKFDLLKREKLNIAIIGGGISGLTAAAGFLQLRQDCHVSVFEQHADLCPLQQGTDSRWLHPHIYDWPSFGSRQPSASLPFLSWREGRASDVASKILLEFANVCKSFGWTTLKGEDDKSTADKLDRISVYLDVKELKIADRREVAWVGYETSSVGGYFRKEKSIGESKKFDVILIAAGFGREKSGVYGTTRLYWQNDDLSQPRLTNEARTFVISGAGDGALVDLFRLTIERFRQDRVVYEIFGQDPDTFESELRFALLARSKGKSYWAIFEDLRKEQKLKDAIDSLRARLRKDTRVILHLSGPSGEIRSIESALEIKSSVLNKLMLYLLHRCGAFIPNFGVLSDLLENYKPTREDIICRYGTDPIEVLKNIFHDPVPKHNIDRLRARVQLSLPLWPAGYFPVFPGAVL